MEKCEYCGDRPAEVYSRKHPKYFICIMCLNEEDEE